MLEYVACILKLLALCLNFLGSLCIYGLHGMNFCRWLLFHSAILRFLLTVKLKYLIALDKIQPIHRGGFVCLCKRSTSKNIHGGTTWCSCHQCDGQACGTARSEYCKRHVSTHSTSCHSPSSVDTLPPCDPSWPWALAVKLWLWLLRGFIEELLVYHVYGGIKEDVVDKESGIMGWNLEVVKWLVIY